MPSPIETARIIAIGSEMLTPFRADTNSLYLTRRLNEVAVDVRAKVIVGDDRGDLARELRHALAQVDLVVLTGGLGPTDDDLTRETIADELELTLAEDARIVEQMRARFETRGLRMPDVNRRQALVPAGAVTLPNAHGTAPGLWIEWRAKVLLVLPGPPREMQPMLDGPAWDRLRERVLRRQLARRVLCVAGLTESHVEERIQPIYSRWVRATPPIATTILASPGQVELHLATRAETDADAATTLERATAELAAVLGPALYSVDGRTLEQVVGDRLRARGWRVSVAESCTGGLLASRLTDVPGSSAYFDLGLVTYGNDAKVDLLGVPVATLNEHGAVSEPVAMAMASGVRERAGAEVGVGVTGIAGPTGATSGKPVGTVCLAVVTAGHREVRTRRFPGEREFVKRQASQAALDMLRRMLDDHG